MNFVTNIMVVIILARKLIAPRKIYISARFITDSINVNRKNGKTKTTIPITRCKVTIPIMECCYFSVIGYNTNK